MAKKNNLSAAGAGNVAVTLDKLDDAPIFVHKNHQAFGGSAADEIAEAVGNPAYRDLGPLAIVIRSISVMGDQTFRAIGGAGDLTFSSQLVLGDQAEAIVAGTLLSPNDDTVIAMSHDKVRYLTSGGVRIFEPIPMTILVPDAIIAVPDFTIAHVGVNHTSMNSEDIYTHVWYSWVKMDELSFAKLVNAQFNKS